MVDKKDKNPNHQYSRGLFFKNYDLYGNESETSPGQGLFQNMDKYKSVKEFRKAKEKKAQACRLYILNKIAKKYD